MINSTYSMNKCLSLLENISARYKDDAGHKKFTEEVYENQSRLMAGAQWQSKNTGWTDLVRGIVNIGSTSDSILCLM